MIPLYLYADGSCSARDRTGGWAFIVTDDVTASGKIIYSDCEGVANTTISRMELLAVINGLKSCRVMYTRIGVPPPINPKVHITVSSDSAYVINCFEERWYRSWLANNWIGSSGPVKNVDLWKELLHLANDMIGEGFTLTWKHVKGHNGNYWNEECDKLAGKSRKELKEQNRRED